MVGPVPGARSTTNFDTVALWQHGGMADADKGNGNGQPATWRPPMLASLVDAPSWLARGHRDWIFERKLDGLRCVAVRNGQSVELWSRNHKSFNARFPDVVAALRALAVENFTLDGELVAFDGEDFLGFGELQEHGSTLAVVYGVFDVLHLLGHDTEGLALVDRKSLLSGLVASGPHLRPVEALPGEPAELLLAACAQRWEGLVAKRPDGAYVAGRSADWCKLKCTVSQELVIGGWSEPQGARSGFGALLVGYYDGDQLRYAGKVGTGFSAATITSLSAELARLQRAGSPFADAVAERHAHWVEPALVANVAFSEWTRDGRLRHPRFEGLRPDKDPATVVRERPTPP
jgi:bifunctional non-homologous end joining protein LigD